MRVLLTCLLAATVLAAVGCGKGRDAAPRSDDRTGGDAAPGPGLVALEGTYQVVRIAANGLWSPPGGDDAEATIKGDTFTLRGGPFGRNPGAVYTIKINAFQSTIELESTGRPGEKFLDRGIYKLEKDQLLIAVNRSGERPKDFEPRPNAAVFDLKKK